MAVKIDFLFDSLTKSLVLVFMSKISFIPLTLPNLKLFPQKENR